MNSQLKKGLLEASILAILNQADGYGYKIIKELNQRLSVTESTLYPILKRLAARGAIKSYNEVYNNRIRRYYQITAAGKKELTDFITEWSEIEAIFSFIKGAADDN